VIYTKGERSRLCGLRRKRRAWAVGFLIKYNKKTEIIGIESSVDNPTNKNQNGFFF